MFNILFEECTLPQFDVKGHQFELIVHVRATSDFELVLDDEVFFITTTPKQRIGGRHDLF